MDLSGNSVMGGSGLPFLRSRGAERNGFAPWEGFVAFERSDAESEAGTCFERIASRNASSRALIDSDGAALTYEELAGLAERVRSAISQGLAAEPGRQPVAAMLAATNARGIIGVIGSLLAGCAYLPLDPRWPDLQIQKVVAKANPELILTDEAGAVVADRLQLSADRRTIDLQSAISNRAAPHYPAEPEQARMVRPERALAIFATSGTTGEPKLVSLPHRAVLFDIGRQRNDLFLGPADRFDLLSSLAFSASLAPLFGAVLHGAQLHLFDAHHCLASLPEWLEQRGITISTMPVSTLRAVFLGPRRKFEGRALRMISVSADVLLEPDVRCFHSLFPARVVLQNALASTEARTYAQHFLIPGEDLPDSVPVGWEVSGKRIELIRGGSPVPVGEPGEIVIRSKYLSSGYVSDPVSTAKKFDVLDDGSAVYRTGDIARFAENGVLTYLGRLDRQVKVRGYRVELAAIESALLRIPGVSDCAVTSRTSQVGDSRVIAYTAGLPEGPDSISLLRSALAGALPDYMIPSEFHIVDAIPVNVNGKIDLNLLPEEKRPRTSPVNRGCETPAEMELRAIWSRLLGLDDFDRNETFAALGADSLQVLQLQMAMMDSFGSGSPAGRHFDFYANATLAETASAIESELESGGSDCAVVPIAVKTGAGGHLCPGVF